MNSRRFRFLVLILVLLSLGLPPITGLRATAQDDEADSEEVVHVELIVDVSGSMAQTLPGGETRMDAAQRVLADVVAGIPEREGVNVGLRTYGHKGDNTEAGREESCKSSELVADIEPVDQSEDDPKDRAPEPRRSSSRLRGKSVGGLWQVVDQLTSRPTHG